MAYTPPKLTMSTDMVIFMLRGLKPSTRQRARRERALALVARCREAQAKGDVVGLSAITVSELEFGAHNSGDYDTEIVAVQQILTPFEVYDYGKIDDAVEGLVLLPAHLAQPLGPGPNF